MKIWETIIALAAACFAGGLWETTAQETITIEYTLEGVEGVRHELQVEKDVEVLTFDYIPLTSLTLPKGLMRLRDLRVGNFGYHGCNLKNLILPEGLKSLEVFRSRGCGLTNLTLPKGLVHMRDLIVSDHLPSLKLPEDFGKYASQRIVYLSASTKRLSVHKNMVEFRLSRGGEGLNFPSARELIRNRRPDSDGVFRIQSRPSTISGGKIVLGSDGVYRIETRYPLLVEVYGFQPTFTITRKADGIEIGWEAGTLQRSLLIDGPWKDVESGGTERRLFLRPSHPYEFFRVKPVIE